MLFPKFKKYITDNNLLRKGDRVLVAVSGGIDSMVLLDLISRIAKPLDLSVVVAHVNHCLRGKASDADEMLVRKMCEKYNLECEVLKKKPPGQKNLQDGARQMRYDFFEKIAIKNNTPLVLTAHHKDDQAETILLHWLRGAGLKGLAGMKPISALGNLFLARPLLCASRLDIKEYAKRNRINYREDATNLGTKYSRNAIRHRLIPVLKEFNPQIISSLVSTGERIARDDEALDIVVHEALDQAMASLKPNEITIHRAIYSHLPAAVRLRLLRLAFAEASGSTKDLNSDQVKHMDEIALGDKKNGTYRLPASWKFAREGELLCMRLSGVKCDR